MSENQKASCLTAEQRAKIENNRLAALERKRTRENKRLEIESIRAAKQGKRIATSNQHVTLINDVDSNEFKHKDYGEKLIDTGAGYLIKNTDRKPKPKKFHHEIVQEEEICADCGRTFNNSFLRDKYEYDVCDDCNDSEKYPLLTLSEVKSEYLLNESMLNREDPLKYILKKNPHNAYWGEMKLYLMPQVERLALKMWESWEKLDEEKDKREIKRTIRKQKQFDKKIQKLKNDVKAENYKLKMESKHEHEFEKIEHIKDDLYRKTCSCGMSIEYEEF